MTKKSLKQDIAPTSESDNELTPQEIAGNRITAMFDEFSKKYNLSPAQIEAAIRATWPRTSFVMIIEHDQIWVKFHDGKSVISSEEDMHQLLVSKANEFGLSVGDLNVMASSSLDFPEDETQDTATIALAHEIRDGDWEVFLGPKETV